MKRRAILLFLFSFVSVALFGQRTISGTVTDANDLPMPGVLVKVIGNNSVATITDLNGNYVLKVPDGYDSLEFSFTGYTTVRKKIDNSEIDVVMQSQDIQVTGVVVTGMGVKRDEKKVSVAVTTVGSDEITEAKTASALQALQGQIPGVNITTASGAAGASTRVIFRGFSSINGSNQPLFIVDGIPVNNYSSGSTSLNGGTDFGNDANDINPDDIESISFLKGSAATAIYGNRAAAGVVIITTKKGSDSKKGMNVTVSSTVKFSSPLRLPQFQNVYGQGIYGNWDQRENTSYGPKFDGKLHYWGHVVDNKRLIKPYVGLPTNVADFFEIGHYYNNAFSISGGDKNTSIRLSYSNTSDNGIMPYDKDTYNRNTLSLHGVTHLTNHISAEASITYLNKKNKVVPTGQGGQSVYNNVLQQPRDIPIVELSDIDNPFFNNDYYYSPYTTNPYWPLLKNGNFNNEDRVYGMASVTYEFTPNLKAMFRVGTDVANRQLKEWRARKINDPNGFNAGVDNEFGRIDDYSRFTSQMNTDFIVTYANTFGNWDVSLMFGHNMNQNKYHSQYQGAENLNIPNFYNISNASETPTVGTYDRMRRIVGIYGNAEISYKSWLNFTLTARNDWSSTLPFKNNSFFYPGVGVGFVFTDAFKFFENAKSILPYGKIRLNYGRTGNDADPYQVYDKFIQSGRFPLPNQVNGYTVSNMIGNAELQPEMTTEFEAGTDLRFFNGGRFRIDFTYYDKTVSDLIFSVEKAPSTGYTYQTSNLGTLKNKGIELLVETKIIQQKRFDWTLTWNFSINRSEIVSLGGMDKYDLFGLLGGTEHWLRIYPRDSLGHRGSPLGVFEVSAPEIYVDKDGVKHPVVDAQGIPKLATSGYEKVGTNEPDFIAGLSSKITLFKVINLIVNFDWHQGGIMDSRTAGMVYFTGTTPATLYNDRQPFIVPNSVMQVGTDSDGKPIYAENTRPVLYEVLGGSANSYWDLGGTALGKQEMVDKTFIKLRTLSVSLNVPKKFLKRTPFGAVSMGIVGNNLLIWTPADNNFIDPEMTTYGNDLDAEFGEFGATPTIRQIGFSLTVKF